MSIISQDLPQQFSTVTVCKSKINNKSQFEANMDIKFCKMFGSRLHNTDIFSHYKVECIYRRITQLADTETLHRASKVL